MVWQQWLFVIMTVFMAVSLYGFLWYMYSSKERGAGIEKRGKIIFSDTPLEPRISK
jgi:cbb3-type cytochrome oxidase subunit 3